MRSLRLPPLEMLSLASAADIPADAAADNAPSSFAACGGGDDGGETGLGFHEANPAGLGLGAGGAGAGPDDVDDFSNAAMRSRKEPGLGFGGGDWSDIAVGVERMDLNLM